jgi:regulatory protein
LSRRAYCERKRIQRPADEKATVRVMNRLMRAGYGSGAIFKLLRAWKVEVPEETEMDEGLPEF